MNVKLRAKELRNFWAGGGSPDGRPGEWEGLAAFGREGRIFFEGEPENTKPRGLNRGAHVLVSPAVEARGLMAVYEGKALESRGIGG